MKKLITIIIIISTHIFLIGQEDIDTVDGYMENGIYQGWDSQVPLVNNENTKSIISELRLLLFDSDVESDTIILDYTYTSTGERVLYIGRKNYKKVLKIKEWFAKLKPSSLTAQDYEDLLKVYEDHEILFRQEYNMEEEWDTSIPVILPGFFTQEMQIFLEFEKFIFIFNAPSEENAEKMYRHVKENYFSISETGLSKIAFHSKFYTDHQLSVGDIEFHYLGTYKEIFTDFLLEDLRTFEFSKDENGKSIYKSEDSFYIHLIVKILSEIKDARVDAVIFSKYPEFKEVGCIFWIREAIIKRNTYRGYDFLQNKIYKDQNTYTMLGIIDDKQVEYMSEKNENGGIIRDRFPLPLSVREVTGGKVGYTLIKNKILSSFFSSYKRFSPKIVAVDLPTSKKFSYLDYKPMAPYAASLSRLNSRPISRSYQRAIGRQNALQVDYASAEQELIYLVVKFDAEMNIWRYEEDFSVFDNPEMPLHESETKRAEKIFNNKEVSFGEFTSFVLNNQLFILTDENKIYKYTKDNLVEIGILPVSYKECLFIIDKDQDKLFYITRKEFLYSATITELQKKEIKLY